MVINKKGEIGAVGFFVIFVVILAMGVITIQETAKNAVSMDTATASDGALILSDNNSAQTLTATPTAGTFSATAINQTWLSFDGVNDYVDLNFDMNNIGMQRSDEDHSWSLWINSSNIAPRDERRVFDISPRSWSLGIGESGQNKDGNLVYQNKNSTTWYNLNSTGAVNDSLWHNVIITFNITNFNASMYIDGIINNSIIISSVTQNGALLDISNQFQAFDGYLDEVRLYNLTLTTTEVSHIYASGRTPNSSLPTTGLILWLPLNENSGTTVHSFNQSDFE